MYRREQGAPQSGRLVTLLVQAGTVACLLVLLANWAFSDSQQQQQQPLQGAGAAAAARYVSRLPLRLDAGAVEQQVRPRLPCTLAPPGPLCNACNPNKQSIYLPTWVQAEADEWCAREPQFTSWPPRSDAELRRLRVAVVMDRQCSWWVLGCLGLAAAAIAAAFH